MAAHCVNIVPIVPRRAGRTGRFRFATALATILGLCIPGGTVRGEPFKDPENHLFAPPSSYVFRVPYIVGDDGRPQGFQATPFTAGSHQGWTYYRNPDTPSITPGQRLTYLWEGNRDKVTVLQDERGLAVQTGAHAGADHVSLGWDFSESNDSALDLSEVDELVFAVTSSKALDNFRVTFTDIYDEQGYYEFPLTAGDTGIHLLRSEIITGNISHFEWSRIKSVTLDALNPGADYSLTIGHIGGLGYIGPIPGVSPFPDESPPCLGRNCLPSPDAPPPPGGSPPTQVPEPDFPVLGGLALLLVLLVRRHMRAARGV